MTDEIRAAQSNQPSEPLAPLRQSRPRLTPTERRAAHFAEIAGQQADLKREAAERRAARDAKANGTN